MSKYAHGRLRYEGEAVALKWRKDMYVVMDKEFFCNFWRMRY